MKTAELLNGLRYIADSPPKEFGGFDESVVDYAKAAIEEIDRLQAEVARMEELLYPPPPVKDPSREITATARRGLLAKASFYGASPGRQVFTNCNVCGCKLRTPEEYQMGMCERCAAE